MYDVELLDPASASQTDLLAWSEIKVANDRERYPGEEPTPAALHLSWLTTPDEVWPETHWVARDRSGDIVGGCSTSWRDAEENRDLVFIECEVAEAHRRRGVARELLVAAGAHARAAGRSVVTAEVRVGTTGQSFLDAHGAQRKTVDRRSLLEVDTVDFDRLREWGQPASGAQQRYSLVQWRDTTPDELLADHADLRTAMNDAPREDLQFEDMTYTPDQVRKYERALAGRGEGLVVTCARDNSTGQLVGLTDIITPTVWPERAAQDDTVVLDEHRGHGLGRWIKVANLLWLLDVRPSTRSIQTFNAEVNRHMLDINETMGFRPAGEWGEWQVDLDDLERSLRISPGRTA